MIGDLTGLVTPDATGVFEISDEFLLLGIDTNDGVLPSGEAVTHTADMAKLPIPFGAPFERSVAAEGDSLAIGLEGVPEFLEQAADPLIADQNSFSFEFIGDFSGRLAGPFQSGHRVACCFVFHQRADAINNLRCFF